ncbi:uncharacterized protein LOC131618877 [Vicia villosa]|uniref:uncharacterized protein LOC131618877 n=1 Tax=Vicia villosa TaxID=3911 RepID=UPI00273C13AE|nr:uncharacterized protein LOC131618877 [Vicia villosa]
MRSKVSSDQLFFDPEIERTARRLNSKTQRRAKIAKARDNATATSSQSLETIDESSDGFYLHGLFEEDQEAIIQHTAVNMAATAPCANSPRLNPKFARTAANRRTSELKTGILQLICAKDWYLDQPETVMTDWNTLEEKFLERFYSQNRFFDAKTTIAVFSQGSNESLNEAWERYKAMLRKCKGHGFAEVDQIRMFHNGLTPTNKTLLDATAGGSLIDKKPGLLELTNSDALLAQNKLLTSYVELLTQQMSKLPQQIKEPNGVSNSYQVAKCELCKGDHQTGFCPPVLAEEVNYMNNNQGPRQNQYPNSPPYQQNYPPRNTNQSNATFSANTQENPKEHCKAVVTRTGQKSGEEEVEINDAEKEDNNRAAEDEENEIIVSDMNKDAERETDETKKKRERMEKRKSAKKKMSENKKKYTDEKMVLLDAQCSAVIQRATPRKESDPGRVTLPLNIGGNFTGDGLIDLGSSINLIPLSIVKKLGNIVMKPTKMTLQLADKSITSPYGVVQDLLVKVDKFFFPVDFVVVDMEEDHEMQPTKRGRTKTASTGPQGAHPREPNTR